LKEGQFKSLWRINLKELFESKGATWDQVQTKGRGPPPLSHHSLVSSQGSLFIYGGVTGETNSFAIYKLDI